MKVGFTDGSELNDFFTKVVEVKLEKEVENYFNINEYLDKFERVEIQTRNWRERKQNAEVVKFEEIIN